MGLVTKVIQRPPVAPSALEAALRAANFAFSKLACEYGANPTVRLDVDEADPDPTDFVKAFVDPGAILVTSDKAAGADGVPEAAADGVDKHVLTIKKVLLNTATPTTGTEQLKVMPTSMISVSQSKPTLVDGVVTVELGPSTMSGELFVKVVDVAGKMFGGFLKVRFV